MTGAWFEPPTFQRLMSMGFSRPPWTGSGIGADSVVTDANYGCHTTLSMTSNLRSRPTRDGFSSSQRRDSAALSQPRQRLVHRFDSWPYRSTCDATLAVVPVDDDILDRLREAATGATSWSSIRAALETGALEGEPDMRLRPFVFAFAYNLIDALDARRQSVGEPYGSMFSEGGVRFPPPIADVQDVDVEAWREAFDAIDLPTVRTRLGDLLWIRKARPRPDLAARGAIEGAIKVAAHTTWHPLHRTRILSRALELTRELQNAGLQSAVVAAIREHVQADLAAEKGGAGVPLGVLRPLVALPGADRPADLDDLLVRVGDRYGQDPNIAATISELRMALVDPAGRDGLVRDAIARWREEATRGDTILRADRLERALELARTNGIRDVADELRNELAHIAPDDLGLKKISTELEFPSKDVEAFIANFEDALTWSLAFDLLAAQPVPGGSAAELGDLVDELSTLAPLLSLIPKAVFGPDNATPIFRATTPDARRMLELASQRSQATRVWSIFCSRAVDRIGQRPDRPDRDGLAGYISEAGIAAPEVAERIARAIELFWANEFDESAHVILPRIEALVREAARRLGIPIVREPRPGEEIGGVAMLGAMLYDLKPAFGESALPDYLINLLIDQLGLNLRNLILHGLHGPVDQLDAALLIQIAVILSRMRIVLPVGAEDSTAHSPPSPSST
jgi:hypothetical protein